MNHKLKTTNNAKIPNSVEIVKDFSANSTPINMVIKNNLIMNSKGFLDILNAREGIRTLDPSITPHV